MKLLIHQNKISKRQYFLIAILSIGILFGLWTIVTLSGLVRPLFLPSPIAVAKSTITLWKEFGLLKDIGVSIYRILFGFGLACLVAIPLGILLGVNRKAEAFFDPIVGFIRYIPPSAFVPLFILWFGIGDLEKILLVFIGSVPYLVLLVFDTVSNANQELTEAAYTLGATKKDIIKKVILPQSLPGIWDATRVAIALAWTLLVVAEIVAAASGLGHLIIISQRFLQTPNIISAVLIIGILGFLTDCFFKLTYKILFPWTEKSSHA